MDKKALAKDYFERHKSSKECFVTSDGRVFHSRGAAESFAGSLKDQKVDKFTSDEFSSDGTEEEDNSDVESLLASFNADSETAAKDAKAIIKALGLKPASNKNADAIAAVIAHIEKSKA